jgi:hypothetical protein
MVAIILNSSYALATVDDTIAIRSLAILIPLLSFDVLKKNGITKKINTFAAIIYLFCFTLILVMIIHGEFSNWGSYIRQCAIFLTAYWFVACVDFRVFCTQYKKILSLICVVSFVLWIIINVFDMTYIFPEYTNVNNVTYLCAYVSFIQTNNLNKLCGPFWEPGIFATFLLIGIVFEVFYVDRKCNWKRIILYVISLVFTFSTAGYLLGLVVLLMAFNKRERQKVYVLVNILCIAGIMLAWINLDSIINWLAIILPNIFYKMTFGSVSMMTRFYGPLIDMRIWFEHPWFGAGIKNYLLDWAVQAQSLIVGSRTSTITYFISTLGIFGTMYPFIVVRGCLRQIKELPMFRILLLILFVMMLTKEPHYYNLLMTIVLFYLNINTQVKQPNKVEKIWR